MWRMILHGSLRPASVVCVLSPPSKPNFVSVSQTMHQFALSEFLFPLFSVVIIWNDIFSFHFCAVLLNVLSRS